LKFGTVVYSDVHTCGAAEIRGDLRRVSIRQHRDDDARHLFPQSGKALRVPGTMLIESYELATSHGLASLVDDRLGPGEVIIFHIQFGDPFIKHLPNGILN
jgi:hypothetical protein